MIAYLRGKLVNKEVQKIIIDVQGLGYEVIIPFSTYEHLPNAGAEIKLQIVDLTSPYGGVTLYGFLTEQEKNIFLLLKEEIPGTGAKKSLEFLEKISKSFSEFRQAVQGKDKNSLIRNFGFRDKTAEKLINHLKEKIGLEFAGQEEKRSERFFNDNFEAASIGLVSLGYTPAEARAALKKLEDKTVGQNSVEEIIRSALRCLGNEVRLINVGRKTA